MSAPPDTRWAGPQALLYDSAFAHRPMTADERAKSERDHLRIKRQVELRERQAQARREANYSPYSREALYDE